MSYLTSYSSCFGRWCAHSNQWFVWILLITNAVQLYAIAGLATDGLHNSIENWRTTLKCQEASTLLNSVAFHRILCPGRYYRDNQRSGFGHWRPVGGEIPRDNIIVGKWGRTRHVAQTSTQEDIERPSHHKQSFWKHGMTDSTTLPSWLYQNLVSMRSFLRLRCTSNDSFACMPRVYIDGCYRTDIYAGLQMVNRRWVGSNNMNRSKKLV